MKKIALFFLSIGFLMTGPASGQNKLVINDMATILTPGCDTILQQRLQADIIEYTSMMDTRKRCDYWFATFTKENAGVILKIKDCNDRLAGVKNMGSLVGTAADEEKALLIYYALKEIIRDPYKDVEQEAPVSGQGTAANMASQEEHVSNPGEHKSRYFFAPSAFNLEEGELYYNSLYFLIHDVQYGVSSRFSIGMGTTVGMIPFYLTPKVTFPVNDKARFAIGNMLMLGTWGSKFTGNLLYATYTGGDIYNNISLGGGYLHLGGENIEAKTNSLVVNLSCLAKLSSHIYFISENYGSRINGRGDATYSDPGPGTYLSESFDQPMFFIYGMSGFRFINKRTDVISWQIGLSYIYTNPAPPPSRYQNGWDISEGGTDGLIAFPVIGFSKLFGNKY